MNRLPPRPLLPALRMLCCASAFAASCCAAQIYGKVGIDGSVMLSNFRTEPTQVIVVDDGRSGLNAAPRLQMPDPRYSAMIRQAARDTDLSPGLLHAVISVESGFNERAVSPKGAKGLMQLMPATALALGVSDPFDPAQNIRAGATHLKSLLTRFDDNLELALAAYNAGADAVVKSGGQIPKYAETRAYVPRVMARLRDAERGAEDAAGPKGSAGTCTSADGGRRCTSPR
ncbi:MAG TPA: lytic transglycosylase domain-containing protein [Burkholderiaceae bacterium]|nr:lytic transglycosylase domain-containing protein [Burkholderiaceae bacterium]